MVVAKEMNKDTGWGFAAPLLQRRMTETNDCSKHAGLALCCADCMKISALIRRETNAYLRER